MCLRGFRAAFMSDFLAVVRAFLLRPIALGWATRRAVRWVFGAGPTLLFFHTDFIRADPQTAGDRGRRSLMRKGWRSDF